MELFLLKIFPLLKDILPWLIILGTAINWWFKRKDTEETASLTRLETLSKVEERLRDSLEKQLQITEAKLEIASKEIERLKLQLVKYQIEVEKLKAELSNQINRNN